MKNTNVSKDINIQSSINQNIITSIHLETTPIFTFKVSSPKFFTKNLTCEQTSRFQVS